MFYLFGDRSQGWGWRTRLLLPRYVPMNQRILRKKSLMMTICWTRLVRMRPVSQTNLEQKRYLPENPRLRATPPRQRPGLADPACLGLTSMMDWNGQEALRNTTLLTDLDQEALERTNPRRELVVCLWSPPWLTPPRGQVLQADGSQSALLLTSAASFFLTFTSGGLVMPEHPLRLDATPPIPLLLKQQAVLLGTHKAGKTVMCLVEQVTCSSVFFVWGYASPRRAYFAWCCQSHQEH